MWPRKWASSWAAASLASLCVIALCLVAQVVLAQDVSRRPYACRMTAPDGLGFSNWSGAIIAETDSEYLIATCSHGAGPGARVSALVYGTDRHLPCRSVWSLPPRTLDLALWAASKPSGESLPPLPRPAARPAIGDYLLAWGYAGGIYNPRAFGGYVKRRGAWPAGVPMNHPLGPYDRLDCATINGDSGSVLWTQDGRAAGVQWGSNMHEPHNPETTYTPLVYAPPIWEKQTKWQWLPMETNSGCQGCPPGYVIRPPMAGPQGGARLRVPPPAQPQHQPEPQEPTPAEPKDPECCEENAAKIAANADALSGVSSKVDDALAAIAAVQDQLANLPPSQTYEPPDLSGYATKDDLAAMEGRLVMIINQKFESQPPPQPLPTARRHIVIIADEGASYWPRLLSEIQRARDHFYEIRIAPPNPEGYSGEMPQAVEYVNGTPHKLHEGLRNVSSLLDSIARQSLDTT